MVTAAGMVFAEFAAALERPVRRFPRHIAGGEPNVRNARLVARPVNPSDRPAVGVPPTATAGPPTQ